MSDACCVWALKQRVLPSGQALHRGMLVIRVVFRAAMQVPLLYPERKGLHFPGFHSLCGCSA